jgi:hypothetical protein
MRNFGKHRQAKKKNHTTVERVTDFALLPFRFL